MSLKQEIESWVEALNYYDQQNYEKALEIFETNADTSKIYFNIGMIHATLGEHDKAVEAYQKATKLDQFLAVAYFQQGVSNFLLGEFTEAMANFNEALLYLRGNTYIDYDQLGLKFKLFSCEVLFNRGLCYIYDQDIEQGMKDLEYAAKEKQVDDHNVIDEAIKEQAEGYTVFSVGVGVLYRPNEAKVRNVKAKDYLGKARLVAASDAQNAFTGFAGTEVKKQNMSETAPVDDRTDISYAATKLVKPELVPRRRSDTGSEEKSVQPALRGERQVFPPTPPPENEFAPSAQKPARSNTVGGPSAGRSLSVRGAAPTRARSHDRDRGGERIEEGAGGRYSPPPRRPTVRGQPEPRRAYSARAPSSSSTSVASRSRTVREAPRRRDDRMTEYTDEIEGNPYSDEVYNLYVDGREAPRRGGPAGGSVRNRGLARRPTTRDRYADEDEYASEAYEGSSFDEDEFEMLDAPSIRSGSSRRPDVKKIKVKAHHEDDTRMIMISTGTDFDEFITRLKDKFGFRRRVKCKIRDEDGDGMISLSDQEDLDMAISSSKKAARRERSDVGKLEIWVTET
ncbi:TPR-like protein [Choiromyces venosus 120613-1]|uniref:TPR-like protein n=1 Tax=Choiromyces venosus 120613-1 TaxID=1336337 RepID=A0A3N4JHV5_9PEZI|nr:TPR-like protein [Choiromyces venosus 120613-1]